MPGEAPPDIYLRFSDAPERSPAWQQLLGESVDGQCPGILGDLKTVKDDPGNSGWFVVTNFHLSVNAGEGSGGGAGGAATAKGTDKGLFKGVAVTLPLQYGCLYIMKECVKFAQKHQEKQKFKKIPKAYILVRAAGLSGQSNKGVQSGQDWFLALTLHDVTVEEYTMNSSCTQETFTLNYEWMQIQYWVSNPDTGTIGDDVAYVDWYNNAGNSPEGEGA